MPSHHTSHPSTGLVVMTPDSGLPGGGPGLPGSPSFQKPAGSLHQPLPPAGHPGAPVPQGGTYELAGWWSRVGATLIDGVILMVPFIPLMLIVFAIFGLSLNGDNGNGSEAGFVASLFAFFILILVYAAVALIYAPYFMAKWNGATPGKRAVGIRVVRAEGLPMTFGYAAYREVLVKQILFGVASSFTFGLATLIDYLWPLWDSEQRALHDIIVNTRVVRG